MGAIYNQTASAAGAGKIAACSGATPIGTQGQNCLCTVGGSAGGAVTVGGTQFDIGTNLAAVYMEIDPGAGDQWKAGNYVVRINVTTLNTLVTWTGTYICRLNSSNVSQATIGSLTGQTTSMGTTGVKTHTVSGAAQTPAAGDKIYIVCVFSVVTSNNQSFGWTKNQAIDTPLVVAKTFAPSADAWGNLADSVAQLEKGLYKLTATDAWQNLADSVVAPLKRRAWNDSVAVTRGTVSGTTPKTFSGTDSLNFWADSPKGFEKFFAGLTDPALNLTDSVKGFYTERAGITDAWNNLSDSSATFRKGYLKPSLSDAWNSLNDSLAQFQKGYLKPQFTDAWQNLADSLATLRKGYLKPQLSDTWGNLSDALAGKFILRAGLTDPWANLNDSIKAFERFRAALSDSALNFTDALAGFRRMRAQLSDDAAFLADLLNTFLLSPNLKLAFTDQWQNLNDSVAAKMALRAALSDDAKNLADTLNALFALRVLPPADAIVLSDAVNALLALRVALSDDANNLGDIVAYTLVALGLAVPILVSLGPDDAAYLLDALNGLMGISVKGSEDLSTQGCDQLGGPGGGGKLVGIVDIL